MLIKTELLILHCGHSAHTNTPVHSHRTLLDGRGEVGGLAIAGWPWGLLVSCVPRANSEEPWARQVRFQFSPRGVVFPAGASLWGQLLKSPLFALGLN